MDVQSRDFVVAFAARVEENSTRSFDHMGIDENAVYRIINAQSNLRRPAKSQLTTTHCHT
jgi:hypothetical protein